MKSNKTASFKKVGNQPYDCIFSIPDVKHKFYIFLVNYWILKWLLKIFLKIISFQLIIFSDLLEHFHSYSYKTNYIIAGENPLITLCLLKNLANVARQQKKQIKVLIVRLSDDDYWGYHSFEKPEQWEKTSNLLNQKLNDVSQMTQVCLSLEETEYLDIVYLNSSSEIYYAKYDEITKNWVCFLRERDNEVIKKESFAKEMPNVLFLENKLKDKYWNKIMNQIFKINENISILKQNKKQKKLFLFSNKILLSSYPNGWLNVKKVIEKDYLTFNHLLTENSFGTSKRMPNSFNLLDEQAIEDLKNAIFQAI